MPLRPQWHVRLAPAPFSLSPLVTVAAVPSAPSRGGPGLVHLALLAVLAASGIRNQGTWAGIAPGLWGLPVSPWNSSNP